MTLYVCDNCKKRDVEETDILQLERVDLCKECVDGIITLETNEMQKLIDEAEVELEKKHKKTFNELLKENKPLQEISNSLSETEDRNEKEEKQ